MEIFFFSEKQFHFVDGDKQFFSLAILGSLKYNTDAKGLNHSPAELHNAKEKTEVDWPSHVPVSEKVKY